MEIRSTPSKTLFKLLRNIYDNRINVQGGPGPMSHLDNYDKNFDVAVTKWKYFFYVERNDLERKFKRLLIF